MADTQETGLAQPLAGQSEQSEVETKVATPSETEQIEADTETDDTDEATDEVDESTDDEEAPKPKKPAGSARYKAQLAEARQEIERLRSFVPAKMDSAGLEKAIEAELGPKPKEGDYSDYLAFERAVTAYETASLLKKADLNKAASRIENDRAEQTRYIIEAHKEREAAARKALPDYDAKIRAANFPIARHVESMIVESDKSAELAYYLSTRPKLVNELNGLSEREAARRIGRIEASVSLPKTSPQTRAQAPVAGLKGGASPEPDLAKMSMKDYATFREKQMAKGS